MKSHTELREDFNTAGVSFLMTELDVALSFTQLAAGPYSFDRRDRLLRGANRALRQAMLMHPRFRLTGLEEGAFEAKRTRIQRALQQVP